MIDRVCEMSGEVTDNYAVSLFFTYMAEIEKVLLKVTVVKVQSGLEGAILLPVTKGVEE